MGAEEVVWSQLVFVGHRGTVSAWRALERGGGSVLFIVPISQLKVVVLGMRISHRLVGADPARHAEMCRLLHTFGLGAYAGVPPNQPGSADGEES